MHSVYTELCEVTVHGKKIIKYISIIFFFLQLHVALMKKIVESCIIILQTYFIIACLLIEGSGLKGQFYIEMNFIGFHYFFATKFCITKSYKKRRTYIVMLRAIC